MRLFPFLSPDTEKGGSEVSDIRTSDGMFFSRAEDSVLEREGEGEGEGVLEREGGGEGGRISLSVRGRGVGGVLERHLREPGQW